MAEVQILSIKTERQNLIKNLCTVLRTLSYYFHRKCDK